jgi:hypothetical protein
MPNQMDSAKIRITYAEWEDVQKLLAAYAHRNNISPSAAVRAATLNFVNLHKQGRWEAKQLKSEAPKRNKVRVNYAEWITVREDLNKIASVERMGLADTLRRATQTFVAGMEK